MTIFSDPNSLPIIAKAVKTNAGRDAIDRKSGFAPPSVGPLDLRLRTAMSAIYCGISTNDMDCIAEGYAMLMDIHAVLFAITNKNETAA